MRYNLIIFLSLFLFCNCRKKETDTPASTNTTTTNTTDTIPKVDTPNTKTVVYVGETAFQSDYDPSSNVPDYITVVNTFKDSTITFYEHKYEILNSQTKYQHLDPYAYTDTLFEYNNRVLYYINKDSLIATYIHYDGGGGMTAYYLFKGKRQ